MTVAPPHVLPNADLYRVNADGFAVGALHENGVNSAVVWNYPRAVQLGTLGGPNSTAYAINDAGTIVGDSQTDRLNEGHIVSQAFVWDAVMHDLSDPDSGLDSAALHVNALGQIVGWSMFADGSQRAVLWPMTIDAAAVVDLGTLGGRNSVARAINGSGVIVGQSETEMFVGGTPVVQAFRYDTGAGMVALPRLPEGVNSSALAINDGGAIVGWCESMGRERHATLWLPNHAPIDLGTLGGPTSVANAINDREWIVGSATLSGSGGGATNLVGAASGHAFLFRDGMRTDLNDLLPPDSGWVLIEARDINHDGVIVGTGLFQGGPAAFSLDLRTASPAFRPARGAVAAQ